MKMLNRKLELRRIEAIFFTFLLFFKLLYLLCASEKCMWRLKQMDITCKVALFDSGYIFSRNLCR